MTSDKLLLSTFKSPILLSFSDISFSILSAILESYSALTELIVPTTITDPSTTESIDTSLLPILALEN